MARGKLMKRYGARKPKQNPSGGMKANPPLLTDVWEFAGPGFGGFAATRFTTRVAATQIAKRWPKYAKHAGAAASIGSFLAAWLLAHKVKLLEKYHTPIVVGSAIAAAQSLIQLYFPQLGWIISDATPEIAQTTQDQAQTAELGPEFEDVSHDGFTYDDQYDGSSYQQGTKAKAQQAAPSAPQTPEQAEDAEFSDLLDHDEMQSAGIFGGN